MDGAEDGRVSGRSLPIPRCKNMSRYINHREEHLFAKNLNNMASMCLL